MLAIFPKLFGKSTSKDTELTRFMVQRFGYRPKNVDLFIRALTHKSISNKQEGAVSNERLEYLGDAILDAIVAQFLFERFPDEDEGYLTKVKSKIVSRRTLGIIGHEMEIHQHLRYNKNRTIKLETIEGNAFEALVGAIYLDGGFQGVKQSVQNHVFKKYIDLNQILEEEIDFKSRLIIWSQKNRLPIQFNVISEENSGAHWEYAVVVVINKQEYGRGTGSSKKKAEQSAAKETLELIGEL